jgi:hypothetical protein
MVLATNKKHTREEFATRFGVRLDQVFLVPFDSYFVQLTEGDHRDPFEPREAIVCTKKMSRVAWLSYLRGQNTGFHSVQAEQQQSRIPALITSEDNPSEDSTISHASSNGSTSAASLPERGLS